MAFNDIDPKAPTHVLIVPTLHVENAGALAYVTNVNGRHIYRRGRNCCRKGSY